MKKFLIFVCVLSAFLLSACGENSEISCLKNYEITRDSMKEYAAPEVFFDQLNDNCSATYVDGSCKVGALRSEPVLAKNDYAKIVEDLLLSGTVATFDHLSSTICLNNEVDNEFVYEASFSGSHFYCTNDCYTDELGFSLSVDKKSREVFLRELESVR